MRTAAIAVTALWSCAAALAAAQAVPPVAAKTAAPAAAVALSTPTPTVQSIYNADRLRDPFRALTGGALAGTRRFSLEDFTIHNLTLRGILGDAKVGFAAFTDNTYGYTLTLRGAKLYSPNGKPVPGVTGRVDFKRRRASLQTREGDVQIFRLGEQETD